MTSCRVLQFNELGFTCTIMLLMQPMKQQTSQ
jgi:hypothetical protein